MLILFSSSFKIAAFPLAQVHVYSGIDWAKLTSSKQPVVLFNFFPSSNKGKRASFSHLILSLYNEPLVPHLEHLYMLKVLM